MTTQTAPALQMIPLAAIEEHTRNVRRDLGDLSELADSLREMGLLEPIVVAPGSVGKGEGRCPDCGLTVATNGADLLVEHDHVSVEGQVGGEYADVPPCPGGGQPAADAWRLIAGHRRAAAAALADLAELPAMVRYDLKSEADQVMAMLVENLQRSDLTAIEEADAYHQLELFGFKPAQIAKKTGRSKATVDRRLSLSKLSEPIQAKVQAHEITLTDAEALVEFAGDVVATADLERYLGGPNWRWALERARGRRHDAAEARKVRDRLVKDGVRIVSVEEYAEAGEETVELGQRWGNLDMEPAEHAKSCEHHAALEPTSVKVVWLCTKADSHPAAANGSKRETKGERADRLAREKAHAELEDAVRTAAAVRDGWIAEYLTGARALTPEQRDLILRRTLARVIGSEENYFELDVKSWLARLGIEWDEPTGSWQERQTAKAQAALAQIERRDPLLLWLALLAVDAGADQVYGWSPLEDEVASWLQFLTDLGYELTEWESDKLVGGRAPIIEDPDEVQKALGVTDEAIMHAVTAGIPKQVALQPGVKTPKGRCSKCLGWAAIASGTGTIGAHKGCQDRGGMALTLAEVIALDGEEAAS